MPCLSLARAFLQAYYSTFDEILRFYAVRGHNLALQFRPPLFGMRRVEDALREVLVLVESGDVLESVRLLEDVVKKSSIVRRVQGIIFAAMGLLLSFMALLIDVFVGLSSLAALVVVAAWLYNREPSVCNARPP
ncbi:hypothetical protein Pyrfu_1695 [Pyrolobus fumarii 1A]|uniref:Uncharacterized protein n=1 Tax=Pyrolobus fumarii (strain DSM 11204 / 1A) TaxID=694429 RepID=G0ECI1_PYRF1|nr:hypothetical protein [Pyrolobus fumarii]AEM39551.1 hypothetical protein Pyrfu_1695 [Pyrolobus fumarii 1A]